MQVMTQRIDKAWLVFESIEDNEPTRCVDLFRRSDGTFGFEEFRRDVEDNGVWTAVHFYCGVVFESRNDALEAATRVVTWLSETGSPASMSHHVP